MARTAESFKRRAAVFKPQATVLVICEDTKSSNIYLNDAKVFYRAIADIEVTHIGRTDPLGIVEHAISRTKVFDHVFCVIDRDTHENFDEAVRLAAMVEAVTLIVSYPCFEYWLMLHFKYSRMVFRRKGNKSPGDQMEKALKACEGMATYTKGEFPGLFKLLKSRLEYARTNAIRSLKEANAVNEIDPSTRLHELLEKFESLGSPEKN